MLIDLTALHYSAVQVRDAISRDAMNQDAMNQDARMDCLDEIVFRCSKVDVASRHAITGHYIDHGVTTAMYRVMVVTRDPMLAIPQVMACRIRFVVADYQCEIALTAAVKQDAIIRDVVAQEVVMDRGC